MTEPNLPLHEHFPAMWAAIANEWKNSDGTDEYPRISQRNKTLLAKINAVGLMGNIVVFEADSHYTKSEIERLLTDPIKQVLNTQLGLKATLAISTASGEGNNADNSGSESSSQDREQRAQDDLQPDSRDTAEHQGHSGVNEGHSSEDSLSRNNTAHNQDLSESTSEQSSRSIFSTPTTAAELDPRHLPAYPQDVTDGQDSADWEPLPPTSEHRSSAQQHQQPPLHQQRLQQPPHTHGSKLIQAPSAAPAQQNNGTSIALNPKHTFDNFVIGSSNSLTAAACRAVAEFPARSYNPLFIWGESGLGKTHLLHAIGHYSLQLRPDMKISYISSEELTNDFINSIATDSREAFKRKYRSLDMLIVDDIQFLQGKESTQEEFFHTFNALKDSGKQIVLSSDRPPKQLTTLEDRLRTRFEGGLITDVQTPDLETRIAILTKKDEAEGVYLPEEVKVLIASRYEKSIRELEGARIRIAAQSSINKEPITEEMATRVMRDMLPEDQDVNILPKHIIDIVTEYYNVTHAELEGKSRANRVVHPRKIAMYLCRELTDLSLPKVGEQFGDRDHTTVMNAERKIRQAMTEDRQIFDQVQSLSQKIKVHARG